MFKPGEHSRDHTGSASQTEQWLSVEEQVPHQSSPHNPTLQQQLQQLQVQQQQQLHQLQQLQQQQLHQMYQQQAHSSASASDMYPMAPTVHENASSRHHDPVLLGQRLAPPPFFPASGESVTAVHTSPLKRLIPHQPQPQHQAPSLFRLPSLGSDILDADPSFAVPSLAVSNHSHEVSPSFRSHFPPTSEKGPQLKQPTLEQELFGTAGEDVRSSWHLPAAGRRSTGGGFPEEVCATPVVTSLSKQPGFIAHGRRASGPFGPNQGVASSPEMPGVSGLEGASGGDSKGVFGVPGVRTADRVLPGFWSLSGAEARCIAPSDAFHGSPTKDGSRRGSLPIADNLRGMRSSRSTTEYNTSSYSPLENTPAGQAGYALSLSTAVGMLASSSERSSVPGLQHAVQRGLTFPEDHAGPLDYALSVPQRSFPDQQAIYPQQGGVMSGDGEGQRATAGKPHGRRSSIAYSSSSMPRSHNTLDSVGMLRHGSDPPGRASVGGLGPEGGRGDDGGLPSWLLGTQIGRPNC